MRRLRVVAVMALACSCGETMSNTPRGRMTAKDIVQHSSPAIVRIEAGPDKIGTGFILDKAGIVATNLHVVAGESAIKVRLYDGTQYPVMQIAGLDPGRDLALLRIVPTRDLPTLKLGDSDAVSAGDQIVAIGNPLGVFDYSVTSGLISQVRPFCSREEAAAALHCKEELTVLQISAAISPGSSGGPLFNQFGEVVGVTTAIITAGQNINLAVPTNYLKALIAQRVSISPDQFAKETKGTEEGARRNNDDGIQIVRRVPVHEVALFDGCNSDDVGEVVRQIGEAIDNGAPLYNEGKHEACYRIYEGTAVKFEHDAPCVGVRTAFGDGLLRANGLASYKEKAWAMRDTFDGLIDVAKRWVDSRPHVPSSKPGRKPPPPPKPKQ
jgi:S1-C subfamily serine protease